MAILVDLSQTLISVAFQNLKGDFNIDMARSWVFTTLISYKKKFGVEYGDIILAYDFKSNVKSWRKQKYAWYKANRKKKFEDPKEAEKWNKIFDLINTVVQECKDNLTWKVIGVEGAEADDVIAILAEIVGAYEPTLIISTDADFYQLQKYPLVKQFNHKTKKVISVDDPKSALNEKVFCGDTSDGIPNVLSDSNSLVDKIRQKPVSKKMLEEYLKFPLAFDAKYSLRLTENKELIDFEYIPEHIRTSIIHEYENAPTHGIQTLYKFFISKRMSRILSDIDLFKVSKNAYDRKSEVYTDEGFF